MLCRAATSDGASFPRPMNGNVHGEPKKRRHITLTDTAFNHLGDIAHDARLSNSEAMERLIRATPVWEGNATLSNSAWEECMDHSQALVTTGNSFPDESI